MMLHMEIIESIQIKYNQIKSNLIKWNEIISNQFKSSIVKSNQEDRDQNTLTCTLQDTSRNGLTPVGWFAASIYRSNAPYACRSNKLEGLEAAKCHDTPNG